MNRYRLQLPRPLAATLTPALALALAVALPTPGAAGDGDTAKMKAPCETDARHRQFDFWIGRWEVQNPAGKVVGTNVVEKSLAGCLLVENWTSVRGGSGKSVNYFDPGDAMWKQDWVDVSGGVIHYEGEFRDGAMRFEGRNYDLDGSSEPSRLTFTPLGDGRVRQFIEQSSDGGQTWYVWFEGIYVPAGGDRAGPAQ